MALQSELKLLAQHQVTLLQLELTRHIAILRALQVELKAHSPTKEDFYHHTQDFLKHLPAIQALEWIPRLEHSQRKEYEKRHQALYPGFTIQEQAKNSHLTKARKRPVYYPVDLVEPFESNRVAMGFDLGSSAKRLSAIQKAIQNNRAAATAPITLVQETGKQKGFLVFYPVFIKQTDSSSGKISGFALGVFRAGDILAVVHKKQKIIGKYFEVFLKDVTDGLSEVLVHTKPLNGEQGVTSRQLVSQIHFAERDWQLTLIPTQEFIYTFEYPRRPYLFFGIGFLLTAILSIGVNKILQNQLVLKYEVEERKIITENLRATQDKLQVAKKKAEQANQAKSNFLTIMSHELRTPMNGVLGMAQMLQFSNLREDQEECCEVIIQSGNALVKLLNEILDLSKLEAKKQTVMQKPFSMQELVGSTIALFSGSAKAKNLYLHQEVSPEVTKTLAGDSELLRRVFSNLIGNAIKFTETGGITIHLDSLEENGKQVVQFQFSDTGIGIYKKNQEGIFDSFMQVDESKIRNRRGTGLGLAIVKQLVELMGGKISVHSALGKGSCFSFTLSFDILETEAEVAELPKKSPTISSPNQALQVLLVEDDEVNQVVISRMLSRSNLNSDIVGNGQEAVAAAGSRKYDFIFMDILMPFMDGYEATKQIRNAGLNQETPIIALTAMASMQDRSACFEVGMDEYITKPIDYTELQEAIEKLSRN